MTRALPLCLAMSGLGAGMGTVTLFNGEHWFALGFWAGAAVFATASIRIIRKAL